MVGYSYLALSPDSKNLLGISKTPNCEIEYWDIISNAKLVCSETPVQTKHISFSPIYPDVFVTATHNEIHLWKIYFKFDQYFLTSVLSTDSTYFLCDVCFCL